jgi:hypothetical protein
MLIFWVVMPCGLVGIYLPIDIFTAARTSNLKSRKSVPMRDTNQVLLWISCVTTVPNQSVLSPFSGHKSRQGVMSPYIPVLGLKKEVNVWYSGCHVVDEPPSIFSFATRRIANGNNDPHLFLLYSPVHIKIEVLSVYMASQTDFVLYIQHSCTKIRSPVQNMLQFKAQFWKPWISTLKLI